MSVTKNCEHCGNEFETYPSEVARRRYCSRACNMAAKNAATWVDQTCEHCGQPFRTKRSQTWRGYGRFCSKACGYAAQKTGETRTCAECGKSFYRSARDLTVRASRFCSKECAAVARRVSKERRMAKYREWRTSVLKRDNYTCRHCGSQKPHLHAHHIKPWAQHPELRFDVSNGLTLCDDCHGLIHPWMHKLVPRSASQQP